MHTSIDTACQHCVETCGGQKEMCHSWIVDSFSHPKNVKASLPCRLKTTFPTVILHQSAALKTSLGNCACWASFTSKQRGNPEPPHIFTTTRKVPTGHIQTCTRAPFYRVGVRVEASVSHVFDTTVLIYHAIGALEESCLRSVAKTVGLSFNRVNIGLTSKVQLRQQVN